MTLLHWPTARGSLDAIALQFGTDRADLMQWALTTGDPLADPVAKRIAEGDRELSAALDLGLREGLATLDQPDPELADLFEDIEQAAAAIDGDLLSNGGEAFHTMPPAVHVISLSVGSLIRVYESPSIAAVLSGTGRLVEGADARLRETAKWLGEAMLPGALRPGAPGYIATVGVRMLHAKVRFYAAKGDYDASRYGVAINQVDLGRTWMDFTRTSWQAEDSLGFALTGQEIDRLYRFWGYIGRLLGVDARLISGITTHAAARRVDEMFDAVTGPLTDQSAVLAQATIESVAAQLHENTKLPTALGRLLLWHLTYRFHGRAKAGELRVPRAVLMRPIVSAATTIIRANRSRLRANPDAWARTIARNQSQLRENLKTLANNAEYETLS
ncbi:oxygenase MpaB family protein [Sulfitobacter sp. F26169L]|uniref:oxygenase MpaB family protein n=1 Tax=Sulfitobacter sp. F26169L TaxID=2996015 RepID=UPI002260B0B8|nr:oxygenase MpaB family protein [Sulfitobacter sp. F26169L]MCX7567934.1 oxygenase MpaB family protein [Sulfitobacter sp. F26169L]